VIAATSPHERRKQAKLLFVDSSGSIAHGSRSDFPQLLQDGDIVIANDAATLPASLLGTHTRTGRAIEVRLAGRESLSAERVGEFTAVIFGEGDFHIPTEHRARPPEMIPGDHLQLGSLHASVLRLLDHPRLISLRLDGSVSEVWQQLAQNGRPIQYSYVPAPLAMWHTWTSIAAIPAAFEAPSAGFILDWNILRLLAARGITVATLTHAAGISSTGDPDLDAKLPFPELYHIPESTAALIEERRKRGACLIAIGTSVVRALEHAFGQYGCVRSGDGLATQRIGINTTIRVVDAIVSGAHERGTSHHELLRAFVGDRHLRRIDQEREVHGYRTHEFGDSVFIQRADPARFLPHHWSAELVEESPRPVRSDFIER
jgi:S-adenosylmethionine:tRNA ribosyltransferase-isomerase